MDLIERTTAQEKVDAAHEFIRLLDDDLLLDDLVDLEMAQRQIDAALTHLLVEVEDRELSDREHGLDTGTLLARDAHRSVGAMRTRVERSRLLHRSFLRFAAALDAWSISWSHVEVLCRAAVPRLLDALVGCEEQLLNAAIELPFRQYRQLVAEVAALFDQDGPTPPSTEDSELFITPLFDGTYHVRGVLVGDLGAAIAELIDNEIRTVRDRYRNDAEQTSDETSVPRTPNLRAIALHDALCRAAGVAHPGASVVTDLTLVTHLDADDMHHGCRDTDGTTAEGIAPTAEGIAAGRSDGTDGCDDQTLSLQSRLNSSIFRCLDGTRLRGSQIESRLCDAAWQFLAMDSTGVPLNLGDAERFATKGQRRAARIRDGGCVFPGCDQAARVTQLHHVWHRQYGGPTDIDNLASLCRHHHSVTHRIGWSMSATPDQWFFWTTPAGRTIHSQRHGRQRSPNAVRE